MRKIGTPSLFIALLLGTIGILAILLFVLSYLTVVWNIVVVGLGSLLAIFTLGIIGLALTIRRKKIIPLLQGPTKLAITLLYPFALTLGTFMRFDKDTIRGSFIEVHNQLASFKEVKVKAEQILVLLPHCLQWSECKVKITNDVTNCLQCGKCVVGDLITLQQEYGFKMAVATGGTLARKIIKEARPKVVIGVACERDLASGIQDIREIHVMGVTNERPFGPCFNTTLDIEAIKEAVSSVLT